MSSTAATRRRGDDRCGDRGGLAGLVLVAAIDPRSEVTAVDWIAIAVGGCIGVGVERFLRS